MPALYTSWVLVIREKNKSASCFKPQLYLDFLSNAAPQRKATATKNFQARQNENRYEIKSWKAVRMRLHGAQTSMQF